MKTIKKLKENIKELRKGCLIEDAGPDSNILCGQEGFLCTDCDTSIDGNKIAMNTLNNVLNSINRLEEIYQGKQKLIRKHELVCLIKGEQK